MVSSDYTTDASWGHFYLGGSSATTVSLCVARLSSLPAHSLEQRVHLLISENCFPKCSPGVSSVDTIEAGKHETTLLVIVRVVLFFFVFAS